jgi:chaperonin GroEL
MHAARAPVEEGIVPGGGIALIRSVAKLGDFKLEGEEQIGLDIVKRAMEEPLRQIAANAGEEGAIVVEKVRESTNPNFGYNAETDQFDDLVADGVIDPTKVVRNALQNAGSIASWMTTEAVVSEIPEAKQATPPGRPGMDMY